MFLRCPYQYHLRYNLGLKIKPDGGLTRGSCCHNAILKSRDGKDGLLSAKIKGETWNVDQTVDTFNDSIDSVKDDVEWNDERMSYDKARNTGQDAVKKYHVFARSVEPESVEVEINPTLDGILFKGYIDIICPNYNADLKFKSKKSVLSVSELMQMGIYNLHNQKPYSMIHSVIIRKSGVEVCPENIEEDMLPMDRIRRYMEIFLTSKEKEVFPPCSPDNWSCDPSWCGYTRICPYYTGTKGA